MVVSNPNAYGNLDLWGKRIAKVNTLTELYQYNRFYSIRLDDDLDGYADSLMTYTKETNVVHTTVDAEHETLVGPKPLRLAYNKILEYNLGIEPKEILGMHYNLFYATVPNAGPILVSGRADDSVVGFADLQRYSALYIEDLQINNVNSITNEELTYQDLYEGEIIETRHYVDNFIDDKSLFMVEQDIETLSIVDLDTGQQIDATNVILNASQVEWSSEVWGVDNAPAKYDTVTTTQGDSVSILNINEKTILLNFRGQYSVFYDYLQRRPETVRNDGITTFKVTGVFITPTDGKVYYTSDKYAFGESSTHDGAKTEGHYLYYDSDLNGFYETVFILTPDNDEDGVYNVISVGYNYDGSHDFMPYIMVQMSNEVYGTIHFSGETQTSRIVGPGAFVDSNYYQPIMHMDLSKIVVI